jgi:peptidoglycan/xylan/chitin deacetylase (PgdA/CDA1 family)
MAVKTRVYITVDTETSMGGAWRNPAFGPLPLDGPIYGKYGAGFYGIPLIMDILEEYGFRGTFFTEVFCAYCVGHKEVEGVLRSIRERGHDAQLHLHPTYRFYRDYLNGKPRRETDLMFHLPPGEQHELIAEGVELFRALSGVRPKVYRAGCYGASEETLRALKVNGIEIDSSYNLAYLGVTCGFNARGLNAPALIDGVYEFPVTVFRGAGPFGYKPLEISAVSVNEIMAAIRARQKAGATDVVLVLHSFGLLKNLGVRFEQYRPDRIVTLRLKKLCAVLADRKDEIEVAVLGGVEPATTRLGQSQMVPALGWVQPSMRKVIQGVNRLPWL